MAQPDRNSPKDKRGSDPNFNWRGVILFAIAFALIGLAILFRGGGAYGTEEDVPYNRFLELLEHKQIVNDPKYPLRLVVEEGRPTQTIRGAYTRAGVGKEPAQQVPFRTTIYLNFTTDLQEKLAAANVPIAIRTESNVIAQAVIGFVPIALFLLILYFLFRQQIRMAGKGALNFGKSKARMLARDKNKITFKDVAGVEEAKDEVQELVEFLRDPKKFQKLGGRIPKGVLLVAPARPCSPAPLPVKRTCRSSRLAARILSKCLWVSARAGFATCLSRARNRPRALSSLTKSMQSDAIAVTALVAVTMSASRR
jgi:cell division protease FtsH